MDGSAAAMEADLTGAYLGLVPLAVYGTLRPGQPAHERLLAGDVAEAFPARIPGRRLVAVDETTGGGYAGYAMAVLAPGHTVVAELLVLHSDAERYAAALERVRAYEFEGRAGSPDCPYTEEQLDVQVLLGGGEHPAAITVPARVFLPGPVLLDLAGSTVPVLGGDWAAWAHPEPEPAPPWSPVGAGR